VWGKWKGGGRGRWKGKERKKDGKEEQSRRCAMCSGWFAAFGLWWFRMVKGGFFPVSTKSDQPRRVEFHVFCQKKIG
jgi:hypothetical protein